MEEENKKGREKEITLRIGNTIRLYDLRDEPGLPKEDLGEITDIFLRVDNFPLALKAIITTNKGYELRIME